MTPNWPGRGRCSACSTAPGSSARRWWSSSPSDPDRLRASPRFDGAVYDLTPAFEFEVERLQFLVWANNYDARGGDPVWWHGRKAARAGAARGVAEEGPADITLADGTPLFVDGGPPDPPALASGVGVVHRWNAEAGRLDPATHRPPVAELARDQLAAVDHGSGAARVIAPAGSGKTRVLTERLRHLVAGRGAHPGTVSALAYNTRAADEMKQRCSGILTADGPHIRTLNSTGLWICSEFGPGGRPRVLEEPDVRDVLQGLFDIRRQANADTVAPYIAALSAVRLGLSPPAAVEESMPDAPGLAEGFDRYRSTLADLGAVDFDEQIYRALEILLTDADARAAAQARCRRLLVDEFQDLTPAHLLMIRLLSAPGYDCFGVGDDDQVIYGYSGATPEFLIGFPDYFPGAAHHPLEVNYRCPPSVVGAARHVLSYNHRRIDKTIRSPEGRPDPEPAASGPLAGCGPVVVRTGAGDSLAALVLEMVRGWQGSGVAPDDIAVLARVNSALLPVQVAMVEAGVPCSRPLGVKALGRTGIRTAFAYLRIGSDPDHIRREDIRDTIRRPSRGIAPMVVDMLTKSRSTSVTDIRRLAGRLSGRDVPKLSAYADDLDTVARATGASTAAALRAIGAGIGLATTMDVLDSSRREADRSTHADDLVALEAVAALHPEAATLRVVAAGGAGPPGGRGAERAAVHGAPDQGQGVGARGRLRRLRGPLPPPAVRRRGGGAPGLPRRPHPGPEPGGGGGRCRGPLPLRRRAGRVPTPPGRSPTGPEDRRGVSPTSSARGRTAPRTGDRGPAAEPTAEAAAAERSLRDWRSSVARKEAVPAYVVLTDKDLIGIATELPRTLGELARCRGIGPLRLERWGDEILAVLGTGA